MGGVTVGDMLRASAARFGDRPALGRRQGDGLDLITYTELWRQVRALSRGFARLGLQRGDRVAILSENRVEWALTDLASACLGLITVPVYPTLPEQQVEYIVRDSAVRVVVVSDRRQLAKVLSFRSRVRSVEHVVAMDVSTTEGVLPFGSLMVSDGEGLSDTELDRLYASVTPDDDATIIYTSGTTGDPKGAVLTHRTLLHVPKIAPQVIDLNERDVFLSFLPLCHVFERVAGHMLPLSLGALIVYSEGVFAIAREFTSVRPTVFMCVPRLVDAMREKILERAERTTGFERRMWDWALSVGLTCSARRQEKKPLGWWLSMQRRFSDALVMRKVREQATGGRVRYFGCGGAPLEPGTMRFLEALGVPTVIGYGLTEAPIVSITWPRDIRHGTVGNPLPETEVRIASDGEIMARGPIVMRSYFGLPAATAEVLGEDRWLRTGDIGHMTDDGMIVITDRKKDIIVLASGKNVAPQPIEERLKRSPYIAEVVLVGDRRNGIVAIVVPEFERLRAWAREADLPAADSEALLERAETRKLIKKEIDRQSEGLAEFERVKRFSLAPTPFTVDGGELTPTLKVRRRVVETKYADMISQLVR